MTLTDDQRQFLRDCPYGERREVTVALDGVGSRIYAVDRRYAAPPAIALPSDPAPVILPAPASTGDYTPPYPQIYCEVGTAERTQVIVDGLL